MFSRANYRSDRGQTKNGGKSITSVGEESIIFLTIRRGDAGKTKGLVSAVGCRVVGIVQLEFSVHSITAETKQPS